MRIIAVVLMLGLVGCGAGVTTTTISSGELTAVVSSRELAQNLDKSVRVEGTARNFHKTGPYVDLGDGSHVLLRLKLFENFPALVEGRTVRVLGTVERVQGLDQAEMARTGEYKQGIVGDSYRLKNVTWELVK